MARPRYQLNRKDWLDCLDWLQNQLDNPNWLVDSAHPINALGVNRLKEWLVEWRELSPPDKETLAQAQRVFDQALTLEDWTRMRKALSARKRRRREKMQSAKPVNLTIQPEAYEQLIEYKKLSDSDTLSEALVHALEIANSSQQKRVERKIAGRVAEYFSRLSEKEQISFVESYLFSAEKNRQWANSTRIAYKLYLRNPNDNHLALVLQRFQEDIVWNQLHLGLRFDDLGLEKADLAGRKDDAVT